MDSPLIVVGLGADGWTGLAPAARAAVREADVVLGGARHLDSLPDDLGAERVPWPSPLREGLPALVAAHEGRRVVALASGDPLVSGVGSTLVELLGADRVTVLPGVSSVALARARMGWPAESVAVVSVVGRDVRRVLRETAPGRRLLVLSSDEATPAALAGLLAHAGYGESRMSVLGDLDTDRESCRSGTATTWTGESPRLNVIAVEMVGAGPASSWAPGLPDDAFEHDGQLTKRDLRASALARLAPRPGELLWDVGAGAGSVGIEWMRAHPTCRAIAVERDPARAARIAENAGRLGVPDLQVVEGEAPVELAELPAPDAVFVGGGAGGDGVLAACLEALPPGGRLVVHGVTIETEALLAACHARHGGELTRIAVETAQPLGRMRGWTPARAVTQWALTRPMGEESS